MAGLTPKEVYQAARLATNQANADAQALYGTDIHEDRDDITALDTAGTAHVDDATGAHAATAILVDSADLTGVAVNVQTALVEIDDLLDAHIADAADAHSEITTLNTYKPRFSQITADSAARNATTTLLDSGLTVTFPIAGTYVLDALVMYITAAAADISFKWDGTATITGTVGTSDIVAYPGALAGGDGSTPGLPLLLPTSWTTESEAPFTNTAAHTATPVIFKGGLTVTVVGTLKLQFTQGTSDATDTKIKAGSWLTVQRVA